MTTEYQGLRSQPTADPYNDGLNPGTCVTLFNNQLGCRRVKSLDLKAINENSSWLQL